MSSLTIQSGMQIDNTSLILAAGNVMQSSAGVCMPVADVNYSALPTDVVIAYTSLTAPRTVTLTPCGTPTNMKFWRIKDKSGNCSGSCPIALTSTSGTFDGLASTAISSPNGSKTFYDDGTNFFMVSAFLPSVNGSTGLQKADGNGGLLNATAGTDYITPSDLSSSLGAYATTASLTSGLAAKQNSLSTGTTAQYVRGDLSLATFPSIPVVPSALSAYFSTALKASPIVHANSATVSGGGAVFQLTADGTSTGVALFPNGIYAPSINLFVNDATSSYQMSYALTNSNKTLTVTANKYTTANILSGILGQTPANGAVVNLTLWGS